MDPHERKVRAIYEALRAKNWKGAMRLANTALQKFKESAVIRSFKAVALDKLGRTEEAFDICESIRTTGTIDEQVLHTMGMIYKSLYRLDCMTEAYVKAVEMKKNDVELMSGLFSCYVRECAFQKQQQLAMKMRRASGQSEKYLWWTVMSIILQTWKRRSSDCVPPLGVERTLKLALTLIQKTMETQKTLPSFEALLLYIDLLYAQGQGDQVLQVLESEMSVRLCKQPIELKTLQAQCYLHLRHSEKAAAMLQEILTEKPNDWLCFCLLLDIYLPAKDDERNQRERPDWQRLFQESCQLTHNLAENDEPSMREEASVNVQEAESAVRAVQERLKAEGKSSKESAACCRTCALMELEFVSRRLQNDDCDHEALIASICDAFKQAGHLKCFPFDIERYIMQLDLEQQGKLTAAFQVEIEEMHTALQDGESGSHDELADALSTGYQILSMLMTVSMSNEDTSLCIHSCMQLSLHETSNGNVTVREGAILAAVNFLMAEASSKDDALAKIGIPVWKSFLILGMSCERDPYNPRLNLAFAAVSFLLGARRLAKETLARLEIKNSQLDSVSSHFSFPFLKSYRYEEALWEFGVSVRHLFLTQTTDVEETTFTAYQQDTYTKILEFVEFKERLETSHAFYMSRSESCTAEIRDCDQSLEALRMQVCQSVDDHPLEKATSDFFERLSFNEDMSVRPCWLPPTFGDYRLAVLEWWNSDNADVRCWMQNPSVDNRNWKASRISCIRRQWCIPHLLKRMWLPEEETDTHLATEIILREIGTTGEASADFLEDKCNAWKNAERNIEQLQDVYKYFQCTVFCLGHLAKDVFGREISEGAVKDFCRCLDFVLDFCDHLITIPFNRLERDLSCWVRSASFVVRAMVSEELKFVVIALRFWEKRMGDNSGIEESVRMSLESFVERLSSILERILQYLKLVDSMKPEKVAQSIMLLLGVMKEKAGRTPFVDEIHGKSVTALSEFMEELNLEEYETCNSWQLFPGAEVGAIETLLSNVFVEHKTWTQELMQMTEHLRTALNGVHFTAP